MKIRAIRVRDVGHFSAPAAIEGLSGGLDVWAAPNEAGKSTLFRALEAAFYEKHTGDGKRIKAITPTAGGSPLIEADFDVGSERWRITKMFGRGRSARLIQMGGDARELRGADADDALAKLIGVDAGRPGRLGFLWVGQGQALEPLPPDIKRGDSAALQKIVEREVSNVASGGLMRQLRAEIARELSLLKTPARDRPKVNGPWDVAVKRRDDLANELKKAEAARAEAALRREALATFKTRRAELTAPERVRAAQETHADAIKARNDGLAANRLLREVQHRVTAHDGALKEAEREAVTRAGIMAEHGALDAACAASVPRLACLTNDLAERRAVLAAMAVRGEALGADERHARAVLQSAEGAARLNEAQARLAVQAQTLAVARTLEAEIAAGTEALAGIKVDADLLQRLIAADAGLTRATDALAAGAPQVTIAYVAGASHVILRDGQPVADGLLPSSQGPVRLEIPGVGVITIAAAESADRVRQSQALHEAQAILSQGFATLGVGDLEDARARHQAVAARQASLDQARARLSGLAPSGVAALAASVEADRHSVAQTDVPAGLPDQATAAALLSSVQAELALLRAAYKDQHAAIEPLAAGLAREQALSEADRARLHALAQLLPPPGESDGELLRLNGRADAARAAANAALRELAAVRETAPDDAAIAVIERRVTRLQAEQAKSADELRDIDVAVSRLDGEATVADEQGLAAKVPALAGEVQRAEADVARHVADVAALSLLAQTVDEADSANLQRYLAPVTAQLAPYLDLVFPGARLDLQGDFKVTGLKRKQTLEQLDALSGGTREQLAVLVRLAFAGLIAKAGQDAPLILDDALAYCDDARLQRMFDALVLGARSHQVLVLTCHQNAFDALGGQRVEMVAWNSPP